MEADCEKTEKKDYTDIILDGNYVISNSDAGWSFTKDGKAAFSGNTSINQGTYKTTGKNTIQIHYTKSKVWDDETGKEKISNIDSYEYITIDDDNNVYWTNPDGDKEKLERAESKIKLLEAENELLKKNELIEMGLLTDTKSISNSK